MAGKIKILCCQGTSKDKRYHFYPYWRIQLIGDDGKKATATIKFEQLREALKKILLHEFRVDEVRHRNPEYVKYKKFFKELTDFQEQLILKHFTIPNIYTKFVDWRYEKEILL